MTRRLTINVNIASRGERDKTGSPALELERLEQETTLVLQEIDHNLSRANAVINEKMFPILAKYAAATNKVWENVGFWKHFMEEAADVEIKTQEKSELPGKTDVAEANSSYDKQIEASTPQQQRSRSLFASSQNSVRRTPRLSGSPKKQDAKDARLSIIQNFLDSSPTLPEPPVLMSEVGRINTASSSSVARVPSRDTSDPDNRDLGRLLPILFPSIALTPSASKPIPAQVSSTQRFPNTPNFRASLRSTGSDASPARRTPQKYQDSRDDIGFQVSNNLLTKPRDDESDDPSVPELQTINLTRSRPEEAERGAKRARIDEPDNVFLDRQEVPQEIETANSRSMSQIFEEVLSAGPRDPTEKSATKSALVHMETTEEPAEQAGTQEDDSQALNISNSIEQSVNSSELGSFLGERWRSLSSTLRK